MLGYRTLGDFLKIQDLCSKPACADSLNWNPAVVFLGLIVCALPFVRLDFAFSRTTGIAIEPSLTRTNLITGDSALMATPVERRLATREKLACLAVAGTYQVPPDLTKIQTHSYQAFHSDRLFAPEKRKPQGIEGVLARDLSRSRATTRKLALSYVRYELGKPRYTPEECRQLRLTYGQPFRVWLRLEKEQPVEEEVFLGDIPIMLGGW